MIWRGIWVAGVAGLVACHGNNYRPIVLARATEIRLPDFMLSNTLPLAGAPECDSAHDFVVGLYAKGTWKGGGTLLPSGWVLTASHLVAVDKIVLGHEQTVGAFAKSAIDVQKWCRDPAHDDTTLAHDIALVLPCSVPWNAPRMALAPDDTWKQARDLNLALLGWDENYKKDCVYQASNVQIVPERTCTQQYHDDDSDYEIGEDTICTASQPVTATHGDSGGPLIATYGKVTELVGVISAGASMMSPNRSMSVVADSQWIQEVVMSGGSAYGCVTVSNCGSKQPR